VNEITLPTKYTCITPRTCVYVPLTLDSGVPSGYARQAQFEASSKSATPNFKLDTKVR